MIDRYLQGQPGDTQAKKAVHAALRFYQAANAAWAAGARDPIKAVTDGTFEAIGADPILSECAKVKEFIEKRQEKERRAFDRQSAYQRELNVAFGGAGVPVLWSCASDAIAEAERTLAVQRALKETRQ